MSLFNIFASTGIFAWPLSLFFLIAVFMICDRCYFIRRCNVIPSNVADAIFAGKNFQAFANNSTSVGRIIKFCEECKPTPEALKSYSQYEISKLERGMFLLYIVVTGAPLIGLLGTVAGLTKVFGNFSFAMAGDNSDLLVSGIALALTTTMLGLTIAIPAIIGNAYINRKIDKFAAELDVIVERLIDINITK